MNEYKEKLKTSLRIYTVVDVILILFSAAGFLAEAGLIKLTPVAGDSHWQSMWRGMISGVSFGIAAMMLVGIIRTRKALLNDTELKKMYIKDHDERQIQIWTSARALSMQIFLIFGLAVGLIVGYFDMTVGITILACVVVHSLIGISCKIYYSKKY